MRKSITAAIFFVFASSGTALAATPAQKCQAGKVLAAGLYFKCLATAQKGFILTNDMAKYDASVAKCEAKLQAKYDKLEAAAAAAGSACPSEGDLVAIRDLLEGCNAGVADGTFGGSTPPDPRVCGGELEACHDDLSTCDDDRKQCNGDLSTRNSELATCEGHLADRDADLATCNGDLASCNDDLAACSSTAPVGGDLVITEIMHTPSASYPNGEWFEVRNRTGAVLNLAGLRVDETSTGANFTLPNSPVLVQPGASFVFSRSASGAENGFGASGYQWTSFALPPTPQLVLSIGSTEITRTSVSGAFPNTPGRSVQLSSDVTLATPRPWYWCNALAVLGNGDYGTPAAANHDCGINVNPPIDFCAVQFPKDLTTSANAFHQIFAQLYEPDVTTLTTTGNDFYPHLETQFGYGPVGTNATTWTWSNAAFDLGYAPGSSNNDEVQSTAAFPAAGSYSYGFRMRLVDPANGTPGAYTYCGRDAVLLPSATSGWSTATVN